MKKRNKIIYWAATIFLSVAMLASGIQQMLQVGGYVDIAYQLHYPLYFFTVIGIWKIAGVVVLLLPKTPLLKEWTYAGFFFVMSGAFISHFAANGFFNNALPSLILVGVTIISWSFRPADRKLVLFKS